MYDYCVTCSCHEVLSCKRSAAVAVLAIDTSQQGLSDAKHGLVQVVADNFDADVSSPNAKLSTYSLAVIITQPSFWDCSQKNETISWLKTEEMSQE